MIVPFTDGEAILRGETREIGIPVARGSHDHPRGGEQVAGPDIHHQHTDAFYVLEGELTFEIGRLLLGLMVVGNR